MEEGQRNGWLYVHLYSSMAIVCIYAYMSVYLDGGMDGVFACMHVRLYGGMVVCSYVCIDMFV